MTGGSDRLVVVTGASRGLGLAVAARCAQAGFRIVGASRTASDGFRELAERYQNRVWFRPFDLGRPDTHHAWVRAVEADHGLLYGLVNNAALGVDGVLATMHESRIDEVLRVNLHGTIVLTQYAVRSMLIARSGRIVNVASIIASTGFSGLSVYGATKAGLLGFTRSLAREVGREHITVNAISPGYLATEMSSALGPAQLESVVRRSPLGQLATLDDVASGVLYLLSAEAARVTGINLTIDAGSSV
jgi:3-oxoacyl-[acyl-carrier protein] reductase